ncbi:MAG: hypothetical protein WCO60_08595 [Verrucomicrobiota bacterium]
MKSRDGANLARIYPAQEGWCVQLGAELKTGADLGALNEGIPSGAKVQLLAPSNSAVLERFTLPKAPREDLLAMAQLQLEKLLPYAADEFVFDLEEVGGGDENVEVVAVALSMAALEGCCAPLRKGGNSPVAVGLYAQQLADSVASIQGVTLLLWMEQGRPYLALVERGRLLWLEGLPEVDALLAEMEVSRALLGAELAGVAPKVDRAIVGISTAGWVEAVKEALPLASVEAGALSPGIELRGNWLPAAWAEEAAARSKKATLMERLQWAGMAYLGVLTLGFAWLAFQKAGLNKVNRQVAEVQPLVELSNARQSRWRQMEPAIEPGRYLVEVLFQVQNAVGAGDIRITDFQMGPREFALAGEAASLAEAIEYVGRLKNEPGLSAFQIQSPNPKILPNERAQFSISAKSDSTSGSSRR